MIKLMILANDESTLYDFRREVIEAFVRDGMNVTLCYPLGKRRSVFDDINCRQIHTDVGRQNKNIFQDIRLLNTYRKLIKEHNPDVVLTYTIKPNIYGNLACRKYNVPCISTVTGTGSVVYEGGPLAKAVLTMQKYAYKTSSCVVFQNESNRQMFNDCGIVSESTRTITVPGSGVNIDKYKYRPYPEDDGICRFVIVSRIRRDKGYSEFLDAVEIIKLNYPAAEFHVVGGYEEEEYTERIKEMHNAGKIIYHGEITQEEVHEVISECNCVVLPSYHEGMANVLLEAAATGRPVIASRIPGCMETFDEGITGFGCEVKNTQALAKAIETVLKASRDRLEQMGKDGRGKIEKEFDRKIVTTIYESQIYYYAMEMKH